LRVQNLFFIMAAIKLYIATSLDNFIASPDGDISWLVDFPDPEQNDYGYADFLASVGVTIMGFKTYEYIANMEPFPYIGKQNFVFTRKNDINNTPYVQFIRENVVDFVRNLKQTSKTDIWLIGGAQINTILLENDLIDELIITKLPLFIGQGIPLFNPNNKLTNLQLVDNQTFKNGMISLTYRFIK